MNEPVNRIVTHVYDTELMRSKKLFPDGTETEWEAFPSPARNFDSTHTGGQRDAIGKTDPDAPVTTYVYGLLIIRGGRRGRRASLEPY